MRYKIYDTVWTIYGNKIQEVTIHSREERALGPHEPLDITYGVGLLKEPVDISDQRFYGEESFFATKQELLDSLEP